MMLTGYYFNIRTLTPDNSATANIFTKFVEMFIDTLASGVKVI